MSHYYHFVATRKTRTFFDGVQNVTLKKGRTHDKEKLEFIQKHDKTEADRDGLAGACLEVLWQYKGFVFGAFDFYSCYGASDDISIIDTKKKIAVKAVAVGRTPHTIRIDD